MLSVSRSNLASCLNRLDFSSAMRVAQRKLRLYTEARLRCPRLRSNEVSDEEVRDVLGPANFLQNTAFNLVPTVLTTTMTTNIFNPGTTTGGVACTSSPYGNLYVLFRAFLIINKHASIAATFNLYKGATVTNAAGTELALTQAVAVGTGFPLTIPGGFLFHVADFLVGGSNTATALTITGAGEIGITK